MKQSLTTQLAFFFLLLTIAAFAIIGNAAKEYAAAGGTIHVGDTVTATSMTGDAVAVAGKNNNVTVTNTPPAQATPSPARWLAVWYVLLLLGGSLAAVWRLVSRRRYA